MTALALDTLRYAKRLRAVGFTEKQAEVHAEALAEAVQDTLVTKADLKDGLDALRIEMRDLHSSLIKWLVPLFIGQTALIVTLVKLLG